RYVERPGLRRYAAVALGMALSLLAKPMLVTLPCVLLLLDYWPLQRWPGQSSAVSARRLLIEKVPLFVLSGLSSAITVVAQYLGKAMQSLEKLPVPTRIANALVAYVDYLRQMLWPADLALFYPHQKPGLFDPPALAAAMVLIVITALAL